MTTEEIIHALDLAPHPEGGWYREIWHWYAGAALDLRQSADGRTATSELLGPNLTAGQRPQILVPAGHWQSARSLGAYTLVGCTVSPGFEFTGFEMASDGWAPGMPL